MNVSIHIGEVIKNELEERNRSVAWLADKIYCDPSNLRKILKNAHISTDLLCRISVALDKDFFFCYSQHLRPYSNELLIN